MTRRLVRWPPWVVVVQLFIGLGWMRAVAEKVLSGSWWTGEMIDEFLAESAGLAVQWYQPLVDHLIGPNSVWIAAVVLVAQFATAISLLSGRFLAGGLAIGMFLNLNFLSAGAVNPSAFYLLAQGTLVLWLAEDSRPDGAGQFRLWLAGAVGLGLAVSAVTSIRTLDPAELIHDPAVMLVTGGMLTALACELTIRRTSGVRA